MELAPRTLGILARLYHDADDQRVSKIGLDRRGDDGAEKPPPFNSLSCYLSQLLGQARPDQAGSAAIGMNSTWRVCCGPAAAASRSRASQCGYAVRAVRIARSTGAVRAAGQ
jgi:hypothetical protein